MPHFPPNQFPYFNGPNFSVSNDRVLDHLRVRQPNTFKLPPATKTLINPNHENVDGLAVWGDNSPVTNETLRSGVAQAGSLVYSTTPILASGLVDDGCFDGRNHLYFSDGDQWIPLANCLPQDSERGGHKYVETYFTGNDYDTATAQDYGTVWPDGAPQNGPTSSDVFEITWTDGAPGDYYIEYKGTSSMKVRVSVAASWDTGTGGTAKIKIGVFRNESSNPMDELYQEVSGGGADGPRNVSLNGYITLDQTDKIRVKVQRTDQTGDVKVRNMNINMQKV